MAKKISRATMKRLPLYYRVLKELALSGEERVSSSDLSKMMKIDAATIRRDFSYFGQMGRRGFGYPIETLLELFDEALKQDVPANVALIGVGNLGQALLNFKFHEIGSARISAAFDVNPELVGTLQNKVPVYDIADLKEQIKSQKIMVGILAVPAEHAQVMAKKLVDAGVAGIMNFTTELLNVPENIIVRNVDLSVELQTLLYAIDRKNLEGFKKKVEPEK